jgi:hypothetical protein
MLITAQFTYVAHGIPVCGLDRKYKGSVHCSSSFNPSNHEVQLLLYTNTRCLNYNDEWVDAVYGTNRTVYPENHMKHCHQSAEFF